MEGQEGQENDGDGFINAADFFRQQQQPERSRGTDKSGSAAPPRPPRESLLVVARNSQVKNKIAALDRQQRAAPAGGSSIMGRPAPGAAGNSGGVGRPAHASDGGFARPLARRVGAAPALGAIAEEAAGAAPARRHAAVVSTVTAALPRRHAAAVATAAAPAAAASAPPPPDPVLPSPATKQQVAEKRHAASFPSIMFQSSTAQAARRSSLPGGGEALPQLTEVAAKPPAPRGPHPAPAVLVPARASLPPHELAAEAPNWQAPVGPQALAAVLAAEAAAAVVRGGGGAPAASNTESEDEAAFEDAASGGGVSAEGSAVWADAHDASPVKLESSDVAAGQRLPPAQPAEVHHPHLVIQEDDAASVCSDASTVVGEHAEEEEDAFGGPGDFAARTAEQPAEQQADEAAAHSWSQLAAEPAGLQVAAAAEPAGPPVPIACDSPLLAAEAVAAASAARLPALAASGASELFQSASSQLPMLEASPDSGATYRASLSPAVSAERRRSSFGVAMLAPEVPADVAACEQAVKPSVRASPAGGVAEVASPAADLPAEASAQAEAEVPAASALPSPAVLAPTATDRVSPFAGTGPAGQPAVPAVEPPPAGASAGSTPAQATLLQAETSRVSQGSSTTTGTPSLHIEFSEASLRYSVDNMPAHSPPRSRHLSQEVLLAVGVEAELPPAAAVTPQQRRVSGVHAASPPAVPANTPASVLRPAVGEQRSLPVPAAAVAQAIEQAAAVQAAEEVKRRASLVAEEAERWASLAAGDAEGRASLVVADAERRASLAAGEAEQQISQQASQQATACSPSASAAPAATPTEPTPEQAASPVPPTPYAATEYDGDDVVMADIDYTPAPTTGGRLPAGSSRFQLEALATASRRLAAAPPVAAPSPSAAPLPSPALVAPSPNAEAHVQQALTAAVDAIAALAECGDPAAEDTAGSEQAAAQEGGVPGCQHLEEQQQLEAEQRAVPASAAAEEPAPAEEATAAKVTVPAAAGLLQVEAAASSVPLPELAPALAADRRDRSSRLSMPVGYRSNAAERSRNSRLSLPSGLTLCGGEDAPSRAVSPEVASSPAPPAPAPAHAQLQAAEEEAGSREPPPEQPAAEQFAAELPAVDQPAAGQAATEKAAVEQHAEQQQESGDQQADCGSEAAADDDAGAAPFMLRSRLLADVDEVPAAEVEAAPAAGGTAAAAEGGLGAAPAEELPAEQPAELAVASEGSQQQQGDEEVPAAAAFAAKPRLSMSQAVSGSSYDRRGSLAAGGEQQQVEDEAVVFAPKPRLSMSPAVSGSSNDRRGSLAAGGEQQQVEDEAVAFAPKPRLSMSPAVSGSSQGRAVSSGGAPVSSRPAKSPVPSYPAAAAAASLLAQQQDKESAAAPSPAQPAAMDVDESMPQHEQQLAWRRESPTMSSNPLAGAGNTPVSTNRRHSHSPAPSGLSMGAGLSNNPMFAGTPGHPTPPSVNLRSYGGRPSFGGTPQSGTSGGSTPASTGIKLAERLHMVAEQLQNPAAPQGLAALATPGGPRLSSGGNAARTPATGRFEFADDVQAIFQALEARTPATALGGQLALGRAGTGATTVQRPGGSRLQRYSFAAGGGTTLLDLDSYDVNGDRSGQGGPTPLLRQQLLGGTPAAMSTAGASGAPRSSGTAAGTPLEVKALRDEVDTLRLQNADLAGQRDDMAGLLGGYQSSIRELQDKHSKLVVRMQGEAAALKAENEELRRTHSDVDEQFRMLYNEKYVPLKAQAAGLRQELAAMQKRVVAEELKAHKAGSDAAAARQDLAAAQAVARDGCAALAEANAEAAAAREREQRLQQQLAGEQRRLEKAVASKAGELGELHAAHAALTKQYDEAVHRANLARQARERAQAEVARKEEEVVTLEVRLKEYEGALREYKKENGKFFEMKERYKATIAGLEREVQAKEKDKQELLAMCNDLMARLEREGIAV
ncbi:hypothetical protein C2E20_1600 [Micractinium conductrix]|uniref:Uncharacterized protein n=1 Tax=Micractinium conductrix TaxID=554055 RepID=A0A2P6VMV7_9CHLO|nr:hypothetical protein C2E20_1600 [Micractinium conductrix]|eukprot:PSC75424.1 hypothetical protein C2E20_1600 [Micractinium conductrix]